MTSQFPAAQALDYSLFRTIARYCAGFTLVFGVVALLGWIFQVPAFQQVLPGLATMKANTAICFLLLGAALWLLATENWQTKYRTTITVLSAVCLLISGLTMVQYAAALDFGIDRLLFDDPATAPENFPGRMSLGTAISFILLSIANLQLVRQQRFRIAQGIVVLTLFLSLTALVNYFFSVESLYNTGLFSSMALNTAVGFFLLSVGLLHATPGEGFMEIALDPGPGGWLVRWMVPVAILLPLFLGWMIATLAEARAFDFVFAYNLLALSLMTVFTILILWRAQVMKRVDHARRQAELALQRRNREYRTLSACNQTLVRAHSEPQLLNDICQNITEMGGYVLSWFGAPHDGELVQSLALSTLRARGAAEIRSLSTAVDTSCVTTLTRAVLETQVPQVATNLGVMLPECVDEARSLGYASIVALPVRENGSMLGVLHIYSDDRDGFDATEMDLLEELVMDLAFGINTIRTRTARQVAEADARYQSHLLENVSDAVVGMDIDFKIRSWNKAAEDIYGWQAEEVLGQSATPLLWTQIVGDSIEHVLSSLRRDGGWRGQINQQRRDGKDIQILSSVSFTLGHDGHTDGIVAVNRDITDYVEMQKQLHEAELERMSLEKERDMLALREEFIATVSHDFRTPMAVILSSIEILQNYHERLEVEQRVKHMKHIHDQVHYMTGLLDDVLSLSKAQAGKVDPEYIRVNVETFAKEVFEQIQLHGSENHRFIFTSDGTMVGAFMDTRILHRLLHNLLSNAVKYSPDGGEVRLELRREGEDVCFDISDEGIGIPKKDMAHIFDPFNRGSNTGNITGTGLGMAIIHENVTILGGSIDLESEEGQGTRVTVCLPFRGKH